MGESRRVACTCTIEPPREEGFLEGEASLLRGEVASHVASSNTEDMNMPSYILLFDLDCSSSAAKIGLFIALIDIFIILILN